MPEERNYLIPPASQEFLSSLTQGTSSHEFRAVRLMRPDWATDWMIHEMVRAITQWRYAHPGMQSRLRIYVPRDWLNHDDIRQGLDQPGTLLGVPFEYADIPALLVGVVASG